MKIKIYILLSILLLITSCYMGCQCKTVYSYDIDLVYKEQNFSYKQCIFKVVSSLDMLAVDKEFIQIKSFNPTATTTFDLKDVSSLIIKPSGKDRVKE